MGGSSDETAAHDDEDHRNLNVVLAITRETPRGPPFLSRGIYLDGRQSISTARGVECLIDSFPRDIRALRVSSVSRVASRSVSSMATA
jgi:hypothetical protein